MLATKENKFYNKKNRYSYRSIEEGNLKQGCGKQTNKQHFPFVCYGSLYQIVYVLFLFCRRLDHLLWCFCTFFIGVAPSYWLLPVLLSVSMISLLLGWVLARPATSTPLDSISLFSSSCQNCCMPSYAALRKTSMSIYLLKCIWYSLPNYNGQFSCNRYYIIW